MRELRNASLSEPVVTYLLLPININIVFRLWQSEAAKEIFKINMYIVVMFFRLDRSLSVVVGVEMRQAI